MQIRTATIADLEKIAEKIAYYQKFGYEILGVSESVHGNAVWYDAILRFS